MSCPSEGFAAATTDADKIACLYADLSATNAAASTAYANYDSSNTNFCEYPSCSCHDAEKAIFSPSSLLLPPLRPPHS